MNDFLLGLPYSPTSFQATAEDDLTPVLRFALCKYRQGEKDFDVITQELKEK